jgi:D-glycero-alpha-D-manno-heptose-7-phosphate kinase
LEIYTHVDCPPGSGLGASSTLVVALIGAMTRWLGLEMSPQEIAQRAFDIERIELGIQGGKQDQFAAAFGGFNFLEFEAGNTRVEPVRLSDEGIAELEYSLVLAYTGNSRASSDIIRDQIRNFERGDAQATAAMDETRRVAYAMREALEAGAFETFGALLHEAWTAKKRMSRQISTPAIDAMYNAARGAGALGGKISGAGGGGFAFFFCAFDRRDAVEDALRERGADVVEFGFTNRGLQTWTR